MSATKPTILVFTDWFEPGFRAGGPIRSLANMVYSMNDLAQFYIVTSDKDLGMTEPYEEIESDTWLERPYGKIIYLSKNGYRKLLPSIVKTKFDAVYLNSLFSYAYTINILRTLRKHKQRIILAPRGMLSVNALAQKKFKKTTFLRWAKLSGLYRHVHWHATSEDEQQEMLNHFGKRTRVSRISNFPPAKEDAPALIKSRREIIFGLVGRIASIKNIHLAIELVGKLQGKVTLRIAGPVEDAFYLEKCEKQANALGDNHKIEFCGALSPAEMTGFYNSIHALFLPTQTENFGHAIVEALAHGKPCIISDRTPWNDIEAHRAGFALSLNDSEAFIPPLQKWVNMDNPEYQALSHQASNYFRDKFNLTELKDNYLKMFLFS